VRKVVLILALALLVGAGAGALAFRSRSEPKRMNLCGGLGVVTDTKGGSPDEALRAHVLSVGGDPDTWERYDGFSPHSYRPKDSAHAVPDWTEISVDQPEGSYWQASGVCT